MAKNMKINAVKMISKSAFHIGYFIYCGYCCDVLKYDAENPKNDNRDYFILCTKI